MRFRLSSIIYMFALFAAAMANFGGLGVPIAAIILAYWAWVVTYKPRLIAVLVVGLLLILGLALPTIQIEAQRGYTRGAACQNNIRILARALMRHAQLHTGFPPAATYRDDGTPLHSWRSALLPYLEQQTLYESLDFNEPWDSPVNSKLVTWTRLDWIQCPNRYEDTMSTTNYFAVVGEQTAWPSRRGRLPSEFHDGGRRTILLLEAPQRRVSWSKPENLSFDEAVTMLTEPLQHASYGHGLDAGYFHKPSKGLNAALADGTALLLRVPMPRDAAIALLTVDGDQATAQWALKEFGSPELDYVKCYSFGVFVALALLPGLRLVQRASSPAEPEAEGKRNAER